MEGITSLVCLTILMKGTLMKTIKISLQASRPIRRGMMAVVAVVLLAIPVVAQIQFSDVPDDHSRRSDINYVAEQRWFVGYGDGTYKPSQKISPSEMTRVLTRAFSGGLTRAEFASFMRGGDWWKTTTARPFTVWTPSSGLYIVGRPPSGQLPSNGWAIEDGILYILPGKYKIVGGGRWMRLSSIPDGGLNFDTIAATDAPLVGYLQLERTFEDHIIEIEATDKAFVIDININIIEWRLGWRGNDDDVYVVNTNSSGVGGGTIGPGAYRIIPGSSTECIWMRLSGVPSSGSFFSVPSELRLPGYLQTTRTSQPSNIIIAPTDAAFMIDCD